MKKLSEIFTVKEADTPNINTGTDADTDEEADVWDEQELEFISSQIIDQLADDGPPFEREIDNNMAAEMLPQELESDTKTATLVKNWYNKNVKKVQALNTKMHRELYLNGFPEGLNYVDMFMNDKTGAELLDNEPIDPEVAYKVAVDLVRKAAKKVQMEQFITGLEEELKLTLFKKINTKK